MNPAADKEIVGVAVVEQCVVAGFGCVAGVGGAGLVRDDEVGDEQSVGNYCGAEDAAGFFVEGGVGVREV